MDAMIFCFHAEPEIESMTKFYQWKDRMRFDCKRFEIYTVILPIIIVISIDCARYCGEPNIILRLYFHWHSTIRLNFDSNGCFRSCFMTANWDQIILTNASRLFPITKHSKFNGWTTKCNRTDLKLHSMFLAHRLWKIQKHLRTHICKWMRKKKYVFGRAEDDCRHLLFAQQLFLSSARIAVCTLLK